MNQKRVRKLNNKTGDGKIICWMSRDQRVCDNWALLYAQDLAEKNSTALAVVFCLVPEFLQAGRRQYEFMLLGLQQIEKDLKQKNIGFHLLVGDPEKEIAKFVKQENIGAVVTDFSPLHIGRKWREGLAEKLNICMYEVDTHNIVPVWEVSEKKEFSARTIRPKINKLLPEFTEEFPRLKKAVKTIKANKIYWEKLIEETGKTEVAPVVGLESGERGAKRVLKKFLNSKIDDYAQKRNEPSVDAQSHLSPYLHFGQISAQRVYLETVKKVPDNKNRQAFLEELVVRRELSENFCFYEKNYDNPSGFHAWANKTLDKHRKDEREYIYTKNQFENARTHDIAWNAAQTEMIKTGKMHGYMRMYWGKKILEWTKSPEEAMKIAIYLNDKYEVDGRDPNGYAGIAWSIGGVHDRAWAERKIFGKIRYMNYEGLKRKFDIEKYISQNL